MAKRKFIFEDDGLYHIYNRGVDKRDIFLDKEDISYFMDRVRDFNSEIIGGAAIQKLPKYKKLTGKACQLVEIIAYALNPNHFHMILKQKKEKGVTVFMQRFGTGYTAFINKKYKRSGSLFQGKFKASQIKSEGHLNYMSVYINLNDKVHKIKTGNKLVRNSWEEYVGIISNQMSTPDDVMKSFKSKEEYQKYAQNQLRDILEGRYPENDGKDLLE